MVEGSSRRRESLLCQCKEMGEIRELHENEPTRVDSKDIHPNRWIVSWTQDKRIPSIYEDTTENTSSTSQGFLSVSTRTLLVSYPGRLGEQDAFAMLVEKVILLVKTLLCCCRGRRRSQSNERREKTVVKISAAESMTRSCSSTKIRKTRRYVKREKDRQKKF